MILPVCMVHRQIYKNQWPSLVLGVGDELLPGADGFLGADVEVFHGAGQTLVEDALVDIEQPHYHSPYQPCHYLETMLLHEGLLLLLLRLVFPLGLKGLLLLGRLIELVVEIFDESDGYPTEKVEIDLIIDGGLFAEDQPSDQKASDETVEGLVAEHLLEQEAAQFVREDEGSQFAAVFPCVPEDALDRLGVEALEEEDHDQRVHEPHPAAVLQPVPESLEDGQHLVQTQRHSPYIQLQQSS